MPLSGRKSLASLYASLLMTAPAWLAAPRVTVSVMTLLLCCGSRVGVLPLSSSVSVRPASHRGLELEQAIAPALESGLIGEQDEHGVVAGERPDLLTQARAVDRLGDDLGGSRGRDQEEDQAGAADVQGKVAEDPPQQGVIAGRERGRVGGPCINMPFASDDLDKAELGDVATDSGLGDVEAALREPLGQGLLTADLVARHELADGLLAGPARLHGATIGRGGGRPHPAPRRPG